MHGFDIIFRNNGDYPTPDEIEITRGLYRIEGEFVGFTPEESVQYLDYDHAIEVDGELKRIHFNKLDVLRDGSFIAEIDVRDNSFLLSFLAYAAGIVAVGTTIAVVINQAGKAMGRSEDALQATAVNLKWVATIVLVVGVAYIIGIWK